MIYEFPTPKPLSENEQVVGVVPLGGVNQFRAVYVIVRNCCAGPSEQEFRMECLYTTDYKRHGDAPEQAFSTFEEAHKMMLRSFPAYWERYLQR